MLNDEKVKVVEALLNELIENDPDRAKRFIQEQLAKLDLQKRLDHYKKQNHIDWLNEKYSTGPGELWGGHP